MSPDNQQKRGTFIHGIAASEHLDSSGERILIDGVDISSLTKDGVLNMEHQSKEASSIVGKIWEAKKILKQSDCENDHHKYFWDKIKMPFIYIAGELFDGVGHKEAGEVAAMLRFDKLDPLNKESKKLINFSIEGSRMEKQGSVITKCIARKISITLTPCNKVCEAEELKIDSKEEKHPDSGKFSFIQDIMSKSDEPSCQIMKGEIPFIYQNSDIQKAKKTPITMTAEDAVKEHKKLVGVLESPSHKDDKEEAKKQRKELKEYKEALDKKEKKINPKDPVLGPSPKAMPASKEYEEKAKAYLEQNKKTKKAEDVGVLAKPYVSEAQRRWAHTEAGKEALGGAKAVSHWDKESKGKDLPERKKKKLSKYDSNVRKALTASCGLGSAPSSKTQGEAIAKTEVRRALPRPKFFDSHKGLIPKDHPDHEKALDHIQREHREGNKLEARRLYDRYITGGGSYVIGKAESLENYADNIDTTKSEKPFHGYNKKRHSKTGGLNDKYRKQYNRETGSNLKRPVTGKVKAGSKAAKRRKSFCARMSGVSGPTSKDGKLTPKGAALKRWKCSKSEGLEKGQDPLAAELTSEKGVSEVGVEARRADPKQKGVVSHGYGRITTPEKHGKRAKAYAKQTLQRLKDQPKPNLPKSEEDVEKRCWTGYEPTPGKKPYSEGSCRPVKKSEESDIQKASWNVREQRKKVFGTKAQPGAGTEMREKHMSHIKNFVNKFLNLDLKPSGGKIDPKTGERRDESPNLGVDKPDWRSGHFESQWNPEAAVHEIAHIMLLPEGIGLEEGQRLMDKQYADVQRKHGYLKQKLSRYEVQPMAAEQLIRRFIGLPASRVSVPVKDKNAPPRMAVDEPDQVIGTRVKQGKAKTGEDKFVDLIRQSRFLSPEHRERLHNVFTKKIVFHPDKGWMPNKSLEAKITDKQPGSVLDVAQKRKEQELPPNVVRIKQKQTQALAKPVDTQDQINPPEMAQPKMKVAKSEMREAMKTLANQAFDRFEKKEELIAFLSQKLPKLGTKEILALAKAVAYVREKKKEIVLKSLMEKDDEQKI